MKIEIIICDRCAKSIHSGTGAIVLVHGGDEISHLCEKCLNEVLPNRGKTIMKLKGEEHEEDEACKGQ